MTDDAALMLARTIAIGLSDAQRSALARAEPTNGGGLILPEGTGSATVGHLWRKKLVVPSSWLLNDLGFAVREELQS